MKRWRSILLTILALLLVVPLVLMFWPEGPLDLSKDEEPFRSMVLPPKLVKGIYYMDGGSVTMWVTDQHDVRRAISFPIDYTGIITRHPSAYEGEHFDYGNVPELKNPRRAKAIMIRLFREYGNKNEPYHQATLDMLSEPLTAIGGDLYSHFFE
ncbi:MAG: hypothetical protein V4689_19875 [Verrucomicrobiota bacterium]